MTWNQENLAVSSFSNTEPVPSTVFILLVRDFQLLTIVSCLKSACWDQAKCIGRCVCGRLRMVVEQGYDPYKFYDERDQFVPNLLPASSRYITYICLSRTSHVVAACTVYTWCNSTDADTIAVAVCALCCCRNEEAPVRCVLCLPLQDSWLFNAAIPHIRTILPLCSRIGSRHGLTLVVQSSSAVVLLLVKILTRTAA